MLGFANIGAVVILAFVIIVIVLVPIWIIVTYNKFVKLRNNVDEGFSTMDVYMKKRYDLIPGLVETVKGYAKHENDTLTNVMAARYAAMNSATTEQRLDNENILQGALKSLFAVTENYPNLKADANFRELQTTLKDIEVEIANSRKYYNGVVKIYNTKRESFPSNIIAGIFNFNKRPMFEVDAPEERKAVKFSFSDNTTEVAESIKESPVAKKATKKQKDNSNSNKSESSSTNVLEKEITKTSNEENENS